MPSQCGEIIENTNIFYVSSNNSAKQGLIVTPPYNPVTQTAVCACPLMPHLQGWCQGGAQGISSTRHPHLSSLSTDVDISEALKPRMAIGCIPLVAVNGISVLVPYLQVKSLQLIWRSGTRRWNLRVPDLHMSCRDLTTWGCSLCNGYHVTCPTYRMAVDRQSNIISPAVLAPWGIFTYFHNLYRICVGKR